MIFKLPLIEIQYKSIDMKSRNGDLTSKNTEETSVGSYSPFKTRLVDFIKHTGLGWSAFEQKTGLTNGTINNIRKRTGDENINKIKGIFPQLNTGWLFTGEGDMLLENPSTEQSYVEKRRNLKNTNDNSLMYYEVGAVGGTKFTGEILPVKKSEGVLHISDLFKGSQFAIRISGNSMTPNYPAGAIIGIRQIEDKLITPGSVYVLEKGNDLWIKRLFYKNDDQDTGYFECISDNTMKFESGPKQGHYCYPSFRIKIDDVRKLFKVTGIYKPNELTVIG